MEEIEQFEVILRVPDEDFDLITLEVGLRWLEQQIRDDPRPIGWDTEQTDRRAAYRVLHVVHTRYCQTIGVSAWVRPSVL